MDEENKFIHNLIRLAGPTNAVTIDFMFDTLLYINKKSIVEAQFIESSYLECIFDDEEFLQQTGIQICSIQDLFNKYEDSNTNSDDCFLMLLHKKHKLARAFLDNEVVKQQIKNLIEARKETMENRAIWTIITNIFEITQQFPDSKFVRLLSPLLPKLLEAIPQISEVVESQRDRVTDACNNQKK